MTDDLRAEQQRWARQYALWMRLQRSSKETLYRALARAGGEPFGAPFEPGLQTLTERIVRLFRQRGFFSFHATERLARRSFRNKFTRHGAAPHRGPYQYLPTVAHSRGFVDRFLAYLRENRFMLVQPPPPAEGSTVKRP